jgi:hypothetical protein
MDDDKESGSYKQATKQEADVGERASGVLYASFMSTYQQTLSIKYEFQPWRTTYLCV